MHKLTDFSPRPTPGEALIQGRYCWLCPFDPKAHLSPLYKAIAGPTNSALWDYIPFGPFTSIESFTSFMDSTAGRGWKVMIIQTEHGTETLGTASFMRTRTEHGSCEVGSVIFGPSLQKTPAATEAIFLMACHVFDELGYRRFEWKCDNENAGSKRAAERFGFQFEGVFRQDMVVKGRNRDTAWYSIIDPEWPSVKQAFEAWLAPSNFDKAGLQKTRLADLRA